TCALPIFTAFAVFILQAIRKIPIQYAKGQRSPGSQLAPQSTFLPLKVNPAGVIPVIFAMAFLMLPQTLTLFFPDANWAQTVARFADPSDWFGMRSEEHTSELQSRFDLVCRLLLEK